MRYHVFVLVSLLTQVALARLALTQTLPTGFKLKSDLHYVCSVRETIVGASDETARKLVKLRFVVSNGNLSRASKYTYAWALTRDNLPAVDGFPIVAALTQQRSYVSEHTDPERETLYVLANGGLFEHQLVYKVASLKGLNTCSLPTQMVPVPSWGGGGMTWMPEDWVRGPANTPNNFNNSGSSYTPTMVSQPVESAVPYWPFALPKTLTVGSRVKISVVNPGPNGGTIPCFWKVTKISVKNGPPLAIGDVSSEPNDEAAVSGSLALRVDLGTVETCQIRYAFTKPPEGLSVKGTVTTLRYERAGAEKYEAFASGDASARRAFGLGEKLYASGKYLEAGQQYAVAVSASPENTLYMNQLGNSLYAQRKYEEAKHWYSTAHSLNPYDGWFLNNLGMCFTALKDQATASQLYEKAELARIIHQC